VLPQRDRGRDFALGPRRALLYDLARSPAALFFPRTRPLRPASWPAVTAETRGGGEGMTCPADDRCIRSREARDSGNASNHVAVGGCLCRFSDTAPLSLSLSLSLLRRSRSLVIDSRKEWNVLIARARRKTELISSRDLIWKSLPGVILSLARLVARACNR